MRVLPKEEWNRLTGTLLESVWQSLPADSRVLVIEQDGQIVGCTALLPVWHAEGTWIAPEHRGKAGVLRRLIRGFRAMCHELGASEVVMMTRTEANAALVKKFGSATHLSCDHFAVMTGAS